MTCRHKPTTLKMRGSSEAARPPAVPLAARRATHATAAAETCTTVRLHTSTIAQRRLPTACKPTCCATCCSGCSAAMAGAAAASMDTWISLNHSSSMPPRKFYSNRAAYSSHSDRNKCSAMRLVSLTQTRISRYHSPIHVIQEVQQKIEQQQQASADVWTTLCQVFFAQLPTAVTRDADCHAAAGRALHIRRCCEQARIVPMQACLCAVLPPLAMHIC
jgi:hypothetical protein